MRPVWDFAMTAPRCNKSMDCGAKWPSRRHCQASALFDRDDALHASPIVVGAGERIATRPSRDEIDLLGAVRSNDDLVLCRGQHCRIAQVDRGEESRRGELMQLGTPVF